MEARINISPPRLFGPSGWGLHTAGGAFGSAKLSIEGHSGAIKGRSGTWSSYVRASRSYSDGYRRHSGHDGYSFFFNSAYRKKKQLWELLGFTGSNRNQLAYVRTPLSIINSEADSIRYPYQGPQYNPLSSNDTDRFSQSLLMLRHNFFINARSALSSTLYLGHAEGDYPYGYPIEDTFAQTNYFLRNTHLGAQMHAEGKWNSSNWAPRCRRIPLLEKKRKLLSSRQTSTHIRRKRSEKWTECFC